MVQKVPSLDHNSVGLMDEVRIIMHDFLLLISNYSTKSPINCSLLCASGIMKKSTRLLPTTTIP